MWGLFCSLLLNGVNLKLIAFRLVSYLIRDFSVIIIYKNKINLYVKVWKCQGSTENKSVRRMWIARNDSWEKITMLSCCIHDVTKVSTQILRRNSYFSSFILFIKGGQWVEFWSFWSKITFFILLNKFNLHTIIYDSLKFQTSITVLQSFIRPYVNFRAI